MSHNERGLHYKADDKSKQNWETGDFPMVCEACLGDNPYLRMQRSDHDGTCKMCDRAYTVFKWRPGRGEGYRQTQVCQTCSKVKNLCQTCILDLQFGLPSQLRDAVLSQEDGTLAVPESEANRQHVAAQHMALVASGNDPWQSDQTPNEKLLKIARNTVHDREQTKKKLAVIGKKRSSSDISYANTAAGDLQQTQCSHLPGPPLKNEASGEDVLPPPGMTLEQVRALPTPELHSNTNALAQVAASASASTTTTNTTSRAVKPKPPPPRGPPPPWAFKNKAPPVNDSSTAPITSSEPAT
mmetsp:Transcript_17024/g.28404  ORF Transcript_17024/g.28404 Transcript_17024/m.28404 type:complete len:298 (+) Transcript_17024:78-971(+)